MFARKRRAVPSSFTFGEPVRIVLARAQEEARRMSHDFIGTEHLLLGALGDATVQNVLGRLAITPGQLRSSVESRIRPGKSTPINTPLPYTSRAKVVFEHATAEARKANCDAIDSTHLLLSLFSIETSIAAQALGGIGLCLEKVREVAESIGQQASEPLRLQIDDASQLSIFEQLTRQITESIAVRRLRPGDRLPSVRQLADQLDIAPGTVARVYSELERDGVLVTEGPRGTRVAHPSSAKDPAADRAEALVAQLRPVAVSAFHLGAGPADLRSALELAMRDIFSEPA